MRPLEGIKILDFTHGVAGPFGTMLLGDLGCDVVKIEKPGRGDPTRYMNVSDRFIKDIPNAGSDYFLAINRNKRGITLDLQKEKGQKIALELAKWADVVVQSFRPGVMKKLGLDYESLKAVNPGLVYASLSAYGLKGPLAHQPGMDVAVQARAGVMSITGYPGSDPVKPGASLADFSGGVHLAMVIQGAIIHHLRTGKGQEVSVSLLDSTMIMMANYSVAVMDGGVHIQPMGSGHPQLVPFQAFPTSDGFIVIGTGTNKLWRELCKVLNAPELLEDPRFKTNIDRVKNREALIPLLSGHTRQKATAEWQTVFEANEVPSAPVNTLEQALDDPQLRANEMVVEVQHPVHGAIHLLGTPYKFGDSACFVEKCPPLLGQHTDEVLTSVVGLDSKEIEELRGEGVV